MYWEASAVLSASDDIKSRLDFLQLALTRYLTAVMAVSLLSPLPDALAVDVMNGTELLSFCQTIDATNKAACYGYLLAFVDFRTIAGNSNGRNCELPPGHEIEMLREEVVQKIAGMPDKQLDSAGTLILEFLNQKYPCR